MKPSLITNSALAVACSLLSPAAFGDVISGTTNLLYTPPPALSASCSYIAHQGSGPCEFTCQCFIAVGDWLDSTSIGFDNTFTVTEGDGTNSECGNLQAIASMDAEGSCIPCSGQQGTGLNCNVDD